MRNKKNRNKKEKHEKNDQHFRFSSNFRIKIFMIE